MTTTPALSAPASGWRDEWHRHFRGLWTLYNVIALFTVYGLTSASALLVPWAAFALRPGIAEILTAFRLPGLAKEEQTA